MLTLLSALGSLLLLFRVRSRATLELELVALRHQVTVLRGNVLACTIATSVARPELFATNEPVRPLRCRACRRSTIAPLRQARSEPMPRDRVARERRSIRLPNFFDRNLHRQDSWPDGLLSKQKFVSGDYTNWEPAARNSLCRRRHGSFDRRLLIEHAPPLAVATDIDAGEANRERLGLAAL